MIGNIESLRTERAYLIEKIRELNDIKRRLRMRQQAAVTLEQKEFTTKDHGRALHAAERAGERLREVNHEIKRINMREDHARKRQAHRLYAEGEAA